MENKEYTIKLYDTEIKTLVNYLFENCTDKSIQKILKKILNQRSDQKFPWLDTPWNNYIKNANRKVIELDDDKDAQRTYIFKCFHEMSSNTAFDQKNVVNWFNSQMQITGNNEFVNMFDFSALYSTGMNFDLSKILCDKE